ncbi:MAG: hypothetical protein IT209_13315 [Armatimonadetes bacterium]|nr:hypothetical protein [Armatimonadota bacterium]
MTAIYAAFCSVLLATVCVAATGPRLPLGVWYEGGVGEFRWNLIPQSAGEAALLYERNFRDIAAHGLNCAVVPNTPPAHHSALLDAAQSNNLKLIIELDKEGGEPGQMIRGAQPLETRRLQTVFSQNLSPIQHHPALWRVQLLDEPAPDAFGRYRKVANELKRFSAELQPFTCLMGVDHSEAFLDQTGSSVLAFDFYPIGVHTPLNSREPMVAFDQACRQAASHTQNRGATLWAVLQTHAITGIHRFPTPTEIRCMTYLSVANGARGVFWFLYQTETWDSASGSVMSGLVDKNYRGDERWTEIGRLTRRLERLSPTLLQLKAAPGYLTCDSNGRATVWMYGGDAYVVAVNTDPARAQTLNIALDCSREAGAKLGNATPAALSGPSPLRVEHKSSRAGTSLKWSVRLAPGDCSVFRVPIASR